MDWNQFDQTEDAPVHEWTYDDLTNSQAPEEFIELAKINESNLESKCTEYVQNYAIDQDIEPSVIPQMVSTMVQYLRNYL